MANLDWANGFTLAEGCEAGCETAHYYDISATNGAIGRGDLVERHTDGYVRQAVASSVRIIGVAAEYKAANSGGTIAVYDNPEAIFVAQMDEADFAAQTDMDLNFDIIATTPDSRGLSRMEIDSSTKNTTATLPIKVLGLLSVTDAYGNTFGANARVRCIINNHLKKSTGVTG